MYIAAIDQGTTSSRCLIFDLEGAVHAVAQAEHRQIFPAPGQVEHDASEIWSRTSEVIAQAVASCPDPTRIGAIGIANQRETIVFWNRDTGQPYGNAIVWQDTRTHEQCEALRAAHGDDDIRARTGLPFSTYFSSTKLAWALTHNADLARDAARGVALCGTIETWVIWNLTGQHVTDVSNASRTQLMNLRTLDWDDDLLRLFAVPRSMLPRIAPTSSPDAFGVTRPDGPFGRAIPVCGAVGDQQAALLGQCALRPGDAKNTYGTGCFLLLNTGSEPIHSEHGLLTTVAFQTPGAPATYALEGSVAIAGALVQWLRDNLGLIESSAEIETLAASVEDNGGVYFVPAFSGLFAPHWRPDARGVIVGLTRFVQRGHIARAALEATCYQTRDVLAAMTLDSGLHLDELRVDGGMVVNDALMQFQADILDTPIVRPVVNETTALGAAMSAAVGAGMVADLEAFSPHWRSAGRWEPRMSAPERDALLARWNKAIERSLEWV